MFKQQNSREFRIVNWNFSADLRRELSIFWIEKTCLKKYRSVLQSSYQSLASKTGSHTSAWAGDVVCLPSL